MNGGDDNVWLSLTEPVLFQPTTSSDDKDSDARDDMAVTLDPLLTDFATENTLNLYGHALTLNPLSASGAENVNPEALFVTDTSMGTLGLSDQTRTTTEPGVEDYWKFINSDLVSDHPMTDTLDSSLDMMISQGDESTASMALKTTMIVTDDLPPSPSPALIRSEVATPSDTLGPLHTFDMVIPSTPHSVSTLYTSQPTLSDSTLTASPQTLLPSSAPTTTTAPVTTTEVTTAAATTTATTASESPAAIEATSIPPFMAIPETAHTALYTPINYKSMLFEKIPGLTPPPPSSFQISALNTNGGTVAPSKDIKRKVGRRGRKKREPHVFTPPTSQLQPLMPAPIPTYIPVTNTKSAGETTTTPSDSSTPSVLSSRPALPSSPSNSTVNAPKTLSTPSPHPSPSIVSSTVSPFQPQSTPPPPATLPTENGQSTYDKRQQRLIKNRAAALLSRKRRREHFMQLEQQGDDLKKENDRLREQLKASEQRAKAAESERDEIRRELKVLREQQQQQRQQQEEKEKEAKRKEKERERAVAVATQHSRTRISTAASIKTAILSSVMLSDDNDSMNVDQEYHYDNRVVASDYEARSAKPKTAGVVLMIIFLSFALFSLPIARIQFPLRPSGSNSRSFGAGTVLTGTAPLPPPAASNDLASTSLRDAAIIDDDSEDEGDSEDENETKGGKVANSVVDKRGPRLKRQMSVTRPVGVKPVDQLLLGDSRQLAFNMAAAKGLYSGMIKR